MRSAVRARHWAGSLNLSHPNVMERHRFCRMLLITLAGTVLCVGCGKSKGKVLGQSPAGPPKTILAVRAGDTPPKVVLQGRLVEKCPVAGCWFRVQDETGIIKVGTKTAGFVVTEIPLETVVTVAGKVTAEGDEPVIEATGLRF